MILIRVTFLLAMLTIPGTLVVWFFVPKMRRLMLPKQLDLPSTLGDDTRSPTGSGGVHSARH